MLSFGFWTLPSGLLGLGGVSVAFAAIAIGILRVEVGMPYAVCLLVVPSTLGIGFGLAVWVRFVMGLGPLHTLGILGGLLVVLVLAYEGVQRFRSSPSPTTVRY